MNEEREAIEELKAMTPEELAKVPADVYKWICCVKGCGHYTKVKSFATMPTVNYKGKWIDLTNQVLFCGKHWKERLTHIAAENIKEGPGTWHLEPIWQPPAVICPPEEWKEFILAKRERLPHKWD